MIAPPSHSLVLVASADADVGAALAYELMRAGFRLMTAFSVDEAFAAVQDLRPDLVVLDLTLGQDTGMELLEQLRAGPLTGDLPVITIAGDVGAEVRHRAFDSGADDCVPRPFDPAELVRRVTVVLRRAGAEGGSWPRVLTAGPLQLDLRDRSLTVEGRQIPLSAGELDVLALLMRQQGRPVSRARMADGLSLTSDHRSRSVDMRVQRVRRRLGSFAGWIETVPRHGYRLRAPDSAADAGYPSGNSS